jgi:hypothetical protein
VDQNEERATRQSPLPSRQLVILLGKTVVFAYSFEVEKKARRFASFAEAEKADRDFYKKLTGNERLKICVELSSHGTEQRLERVSRITKRPKR